LKTEGVEKGCTETPRILASSFGLRASAALGTLQVDSLLVQPSGLL
jgi:hypothetical protein